MRFLDHRIDRVRLLNRKPHRGYRTGMFIPGHDVPLVRVTGDNLCDALALHAQMVVTAHDVYPMAEIVTQAFTTSFRWVDILVHSHVEMGGVITCSAHIDTDHIEPIAVQTSMPMPDAHWSVDFTRTTSTGTGGNSGHAQTYDPIAAQDLAQEILDWGRSEDTPVRVTVAVDGHITLWLAWPEPGDPRSIADLTWFREIGARPPPEVMDDPLFTVTFDDPAQARQVLETARTLAGGERRLMDALRETPGP